MKAGLVSRKSIVNGVNPCYCWFPLRGGAYRPTWKLDVFAIFMRLREFSRRFFVFLPGPAALLSGWLFAGTAFAGPVVISTGEFSGWTSVVIAGPAGGQVSTPVAIGGNPGAYLSVQTVTGAVTRTVHFNSALVYDPSAGAINSVTSSIDFRAFSAFGDGQAFSTLVLIQGGNFFDTQNDVTGATSSVWTTVGPQSFSIGNFFQTGGTGAVLDFSISGAPITIGFLTANDGGGGIIVGYDNFSASFDVVLSLPAPGTVFIFTFAVIALMVQRKFQPQCR